jgi:4'-phosphopantetheinyl transferase
MSAAAVLAEPAQTAGPFAANCLAPGEVEVWQASLDGQPEETRAAMTASLSSDELRRAAGFRFERDRQRFVMARGVLRMLLGHHLGCGPQEVALTYGEQGKPAVASGGLAFNVAHADGLGAFAFARQGAVGIDVERVRPVTEWREIAATHFPTEEAAQLAACSPPERDREFLKAWTRHEAILKARGTGLGGDASRGQAADFRVCSWEPAPGFVSALAVPAGVRWLTRRAWPGPAGEIAPAPAASRISLNLFSESSPNLP